MGGTTEVQEDWVEEVVVVEEGSTAWLSKVVELVGEEEEVVVAVVEGVEGVEATVTAAAPWRNSCQAASLVWSRRRVEGARRLGWGARTCWGWG